MERISGEIPNPYWKAILDVKEFLENMDTYYLKSKKQYETFVKSFLDYLLKDRIFMDDFRKYGTCNIDCIVSLKDGNKGKVEEMYYH